MTVRHDEPATASEAHGAGEVRGGVSLGAVLTGVVVAFGAMFLLSAIVGAIVVATDAFEDAPAGNDAVTLSVVAGLLLVAMQFVSYFWGGYTAGRMGRGAGPLNGALVPLLALIVAAVTTGIAAWLGVEARVNAPFQTTRLPIDEDMQVRIGLGIGIATLLAMFLGGILGGIRGARWHSKLEDPASKPHARVRL